MSIDIGFGDVVSPRPINLDYPTLLSNIPGISISAYSLETVIAEKFHAMIERDGNNSRMKDFFDCYYLFKSHAFDNEMLYNAIRSTFTNRDLTINPDLLLFTPEFSTAENRIVRWQSFLRKINWSEPLEFKEVMDVIKMKLRSHYEKFINESYNNQV